MRVPIGVPLPRGCPVAGHAATPPFRGGRVPPPALTTWAAARRRERWALCARTAAERLLGRPSDGSGSAESWLQARRAHRTQDEALWLVMHARDDPAEARTQQMA